MRSILPHWLEGLAVAGLLCTALVLGGCDSKSCNYWGHATCVDIIITPNKKIIDHYFLRPKLKIK